MSLKVISLTKKVKLIYIYGQNLTITATLIVDLVSKNNNITIHCEPINSKEYKKAKEKILKLAAIEADKILKTK